MSNLESLSYVMNLFLHILKMDITRFGNKQILQFHRNLCSKFKKSLIIILSILSGSFANKNKDNKYHSNQQIC